MTAAALAVVCMLAAQDGSPPDAEALLRAGRERIDALGTYRMRFTKEERLASGWVGPQVMELVVRERPYAVKAVVLEGPNQGRRFMFDSQQNQRELRVREAGLLGLAALWIDIDSPLTRDDTRHPVTELGYGFVQSMIERDARLCAAAGVSHTQVDEGRNRQGDRCVLLIAPKGVQGLYAEKARICVDETSRLLTMVEVSDSRGVRERFQFELLDENLQKKKSGDVTFDADAI